MAERLKDLLKEDEETHSPEEDKSRRKLREARAKDLGAEYLVFVKSMCQHRVTVKQCQNHQIILQKDSIVMRCESILGTERKWEFLIDKFFKPGVVTIDVTERWFNLMMMKIAPGPFEIHKHFILMNRKTKIEFTNMLFEEVVTWKQQENYFM